MSLENVLYKLRMTRNMSQEQFAELLGISRQSVQKWESGASVPKLDMLVRIGKHFGVSLDTLILDSNGRFIEEMNTNRQLRPNYEKMHKWEIYCADLLTEYEQSTDEGLDLRIYEGVFQAVAMLPTNEIKKRLGDILFEAVINAKTVDNYPYNEPSDLEEILNCRTAAPALPALDKTRLEHKLLGAWTGRICGCLFGKTVEGIKTDELIPFLKETGNYPLHRYILQSDISEEILNKYKYRFTGRCYADAVDGFPADDDINYTVLAQQIVERYGRSFTSCDVSREWLDLQSKNVCCTAERVAYRNFINGYEPPETAVYKNPYREWIGAQIRGDYFGYINPGDPELAAEMAYRDACISHVKNGIYGEMFVAAMLAAAACTNDIETILTSGLAQIPHTSRLHAAISDVLAGYEKGVSKEDCFADIHARFNEYTEHGWCHTIPNAMIVAAGLLYGGGDYSKSLCMTVETGFDTDCNAATVGSILGMANGIESIASCWTKPLNGKLHTSIFGMETTTIAERVAQTLQHIQ